MGVQKQEIDFMPKGKLDFLLNEPILTESETIAKCQSVMPYRPASVLVKPCYVQAAVALLRNEEIQVGTTVGCPDGSNNSQIKVAEAKRALTEGATYLAVFVNVGFVKEQKPEDLKADLHAVSGIAHMNGAIMEVMFDIGLLGKNEILLTAQTASQADADILSVPIEFKNGQWDLTLFEMLRKKVGDSLQLKGVAQWGEIRTEQKPHMKSHDRLGITGY